MTADELEDMIMDFTISDDKVLEALKEFLADKYDDNGTHITPTRQHLRDSTAIRVLIEQLRPDVADRIMQDVINQHRGCC